MAKAFLARERLGALLKGLCDAGYRCVGPRLRDGAIVYDTLESADDLPRGVRDAQAPGVYRHEVTAGPRCFAWANGPQALKPLVFAPSETLWEARRNQAGALQFVEAAPAAGALAVLGVRACDLAALRLQDRHFLEGPQPDRAYAARRAALFLVAVNCSHPAETCFCVSTGDGPAADAGFDIAMDELDAGFVVEAGSDAGREVLDRLALPAADEAAIEAVGSQRRAAAGGQVRGLPSRDLRDALLTRLEHPRWEQVAARCLACGNCTQVCPTCFCHAHEARPRLDGRASEHLRRWDSCFTQGHSYIHGLTVRADIRSRYRQWLTHKLGTWHDQYGRSGCVGCGRCITWCPTGIDITEEAAAICGDGGP
ncbi:MAG: sulfite reductase subunit A [Gammaproteobacteria bacterium]|nr:sulfite reductase subunit A [Gammaproteobacteria bacterium]